MADDFDLLKELSRIKDPEALDAVERVIAHFVSRIEKLEEEFSNIIETAVVRHNETKASAETAREAKARWSKRA